MAPTSSPSPDGLDTKDITTVHNSEQDDLSDRHHTVEKVHGNAANDESIDTNFQAGVQKAEAITIAWNVKALIVAYIAIWCVYFVQGIITGVSGALIPYVTSDFAAHSLIPTTSVMSQVIGGVTNLAVAKILDVFGRPHGFALCASMSAGTSDTDPGTGCRRLEVSPGECSS